MVVITRPGLPGHYGLFSQIPYGQISICLDLLTNNWVIIGLQWLINIVRDQAIETEQTGYETSIRT